MRVQKVGTNNESEPIILKFSDYYKPKEETNTGHIQEDKVITPKQVNEVKSSNTSLSPGIIISFLTSTVLAIGSYTTTVLDRFKDPTKELIQLGLTSTSLFLGTAAASNFLNMISNKKNDIN